MKKQRQKKYTLYYAGPLKEVDEDEVFFKSLYKMSPAQKMIETWQLTETSILLQNKDPNELRLDRTTLILKRI